MVLTNGDSRSTLRGLDVSQAPRTRVRRPHLRRPGPPGALTIARALPVGARVAETQHDWLREVEDHPAVAQLRADAHGHLLELARVLAWSADWRSRTTRPTWERLCDRTGLSRRTVARWLAWMRTTGLLGVVETGSTPQLRPLALSGLVEGNRAALYVLASPAAALPVDESGTPSDLTEGESPQRTRGDQPTSPLREPESRTAAPRSPWRWTEPTKHGRGRLGCAQRLQERVPALRPLSDRHLRHLLRPWLLAGWTAADVVWAIDHAPDGTAHTWTTDVRSPKGWLKHRLSLWTDVEGAPLRPLSQATAEQVERRRQVQDATRAASAERATVLEQERDLGERLRGAAAERWEQLLAVVGLRLGRRTPGPMAQALARAAVVEILTVETDQATPEQLAAALDGALAREAAA